MATGNSRSAPLTFERLSQLFLDSSNWTALSADADEFATKEIKKARIEDAISAKEACKALFDKKFAGLFATGHARIEICSGKLSGVQAVMPYSKANKVHLFRSTGQGWMDILFAKRYVYEYARELGLSKHNFRVKPSDLGRAYSQTAWENATINDTAFGGELTSRAKVVEDSLALHSQSTYLETLVALAWVGRTHELLEQRGSISSGRSRSLVINVISARNGYHLDGDRMCRLTS
jgi:hypothetical protein